MYALICRCSVHINFHKQSKQDKGHYIRVKMTRSATAPTNTTITLSVWMAVYIWIKHLLDYNWIECDYTMVSHCEGKHQRALRPFGCVLNASRKLLTPAKGDVCKCMCSVFAFIFSRNTHTF